ncbi:hypothetical protein DESA109040_02130 [Deinococcus saxicola]
MVKVHDSGVQPQKFLRSFFSFKPLLLSFLTPCRSVRLLNDIVAASRGKHLLMVDPMQAGKVTDGSSVALQLIHVDDLWDVVSTHKPRQEGLRGFGISMPLKENVEHEAVLVHRPPQPMPDAIHRRADLVQVPAETPAGFPLAQSFCEQGTEFHAPFAEGLMADLNAALVQQFLNISVAEREAVVQPHSVLDDDHWEAVSVGLGVGHGWSPYPSPVKAT